MKTPRFLATSISALILADPFSASALNKVINASTGTATPWGTAGSWTASGVPTLTDNVEMKSAGAINISGATLGGATNVQDLKFNGTGAIALRNDDSAQNLILTLNGRGTSTPLIDASNGQSYSILGTGLGGRTLSLLLAQSGDFVVANGGNLSVTANISQDATPRYVAKMGRGTLTLGGTNTFTNGLLVNEGKVTLSGSLNPSSAVTVTSGLTPSTFEITSSVLNAYAITVGTKSNFILGAAGRIGNGGTVTLNGSLGRIESTTGSVFTTNVNAGATARVTGTIATGSTMNVNSGGTLLGSGTVNGTTRIFAGGTVQPGFNGTGNLTVSNLTFETGATSVRHSIGTSVGTTPKLNATALTVNGAVGSVTINIPSIDYTGVFPQTFPVIDYSGSILGANGFNAFALGTRPTRTMASLVLNGVDGRIDLLLTSFDYPVWTGNLGGEWITGVQGGVENWALSSSPGTGTDFRVQDTVLFSDTAPGAAISVAINGGDVTPSAVTFTNATKPYTISGGSGIAGSTGIIKSGAARVEIANTNSFSGAITINAGTLAAKSIANAGTNSSLGKGTDIIINGAATTLEYTGTGSESTDRPITITGGATIKTTSVSSVVTLSGAISGSGNLTKTGLGTLVLAAENEYGNTVISEGTLQVGDSGNDNYGTLGLGTLVTNNAQLVFDLPSDVTVPQRIIGTGSLTKRGTATLTLTSGPGAVGTDHNTYTGGTIIENGTIVAAKTGPALIAIPGALTIESDGGFRLAAANQFHSSSVVTINGGNFGDPNDGNTLPITESFTRIQMNAGFFTSGRTTTGITLTDRFKIDGGTAYISRGGVMTSARVEVNGPGEIILDGGSTSAGGESKLTVGASGLSLDNATITFNTGYGVVSAVGATSKGSIIALNGPLTATGTNEFVKTSVAGPVANLDLGGQSRTIQVTAAGDILRLGTSASPIIVVNGGITKTGDGTLILAGPQSYSLPTTINGGRLQISGALSTSGATVAAGTTLAGTGSTASGLVTVATNGTLDVGNRGIGGLTFPSLTFNSTQASQAVVNLTRNPTPAIVTVTGALTATQANSVLLLISGDVPDVGFHTLIDYGSAISPATFNAFTIGLLPNNVNGTLFNNTTIGAIQLQVTSSDKDVWSGALSSVWSGGTLANPKNWVLSSTSAPIDFREADAVIFNDSAVRTSVEINSGYVSPAALRFENVTKDITISGSDGVADVTGGTTGLLKTGAGTVSLFSANTFSGDAVIRAGKVIVTAVGDSGQSGGLGAGSVITLGDTATSATLQVDSPADLSNRSITINGSGNTGGATIATDGFLVLSGTISGNGKLTKTGTGGLQLEGSNASYAPGINIDGGTVRFFNPAALGTVNKVVTLNGGILEYAGSAKLIFADPDAAGPKPRTIVVGPLGGGISVPTSAPDDNGGLWFSINNSISGTGLLRKYGDSTLRLTVPNTTFTGGWSVDEGALDIWTTTALGSAAGTVTVNTSGTLVANGIAIQNPIILNGGTLGTRGTDGTIFTGNVSVAADSFARMNSFVATGTQLSMEIRGLMSGNGKLSTIVELNTAASSKTLRISNSGNTFNGLFDITQNQILLAQATANVGNTLGTADVQLKGSTLQIKNNGTGNSGALSYVGTDIIVQPISGSVSTSAISVTNAGVNSSNSVRLGGLIVVDDPLFDLATTVSLTASNSYTLGFDGASTLDGPINLLPAFNLDFNGTVGGSGKVTYNGGATTLRMTNPANTFSGEWIMPTGTTLMSEPSTGGNTGSTLGSGLIRLTGATARLRDNGTGSNQSLVFGNNLVNSGSSTVEVRSVNGGNTGSTIKLGSLAMASGSTLSTTTTSGYKLAFNGTTTLSGAATFNPTADLELNGAISGSFGITKNGTGRLAINSPANTFTTMTVNAGTLGGVGLIPGNLTAAAAATIAPGNGTGIFSVGGNVSLAVGTDFSVDLGRGTGPQPVAGEYDQLRVGTGVGVASTGTVTLTNADLVINAPGGLQHNDIFFLMINDGIDAVTGTFQGKADGAIFTEDGYTLQISYFADSASGSMTGGNDVAIMVPEPTGVALMLGGLATVLCRRRRKS